LERGMMLRKRNDTLIENRWRVPDTIELMRL
jgi:hypothetical protein